MTQDAFQPLGPTVNFTGATSAPTAVQPNPSNVVNTNFRFVNTGAVTVFLGTGTTAALAGTAASVTTGIPLVAGSATVMSFPAGTFFTGITASSTAVVYVTQGQGLL
jgi:hypothetical protein